jgi:hypothetical protein
MCSKVCNFIFLNVVGKLSFVPHGFQGIRRWREGLWLYALGAAAECATLTYHVRSYVSGFF